MSSRLVIPLALDPSSMGRPVVELPHKPSGVSRVDLSSCLDPDPFAGTWRPRLRLVWTNPGGLTNVKVEFFRDGVSEGVDTLSGAAASNTHSYADSPNSGVPSIDAFADVWFVNAAGEGPKTRCATLTLLDPC